jgi:hypothetical protein
MRHHCPGRAVPFQNAVQKHLSQLSQKHIDEQITIEIFMKMKDLGFLVHVWTVYKFGYEKVEVG